MTSKEIEETAATDLSDRTWMKEIALQLALLNEKPTQNQQVVMARRKQ